MPGPQPTPTALLQLRGSWRANTRENEPTPEPVTEIDPPKGLPAKAKRVWLELAPRLVASKVLTVADLPSFARYCRLYVAWQAAMKLVESKPDRSAVLALRAIDDMLRKLEASFGLTPADRVGLHVEPENKDPRARFFETRAG